MRREIRSSGLILDVPDDFEAPERASARRRTRRRGAAVPGNDLDALLAPLVDEGMQVLDEVELQPREPGRARRGRARDEEPRAKLRLTLEDDECAVVLLEEEGVYRWQFGQELVAERRRGRRGARPDTIRQVTFDIPLGDVPRSGRTRGLGDFLADRVVGKLKAVVLKFAAGVAVVGATKLLERNVNEGLVLLGGSDPKTWRRVDPGDVRVRAKQPRVLLFVHGTFSSTVNSYGALGASAWGRRFLDDLRRRYDVVLGFDHRTLSEDPLENAVKILDALQRIDWKTPPVLDAIAYSRGGLVARSLIEQLLPSSGWPARFENAVFVGSTNAGTQLAEPDNWYLLVDLYTNLALGAARALAAMSAGVAAAFVPGLLRGIGSFVKAMAAQAVTERRVPGLSAMEPDGPFVRELNATQPGQPTAETISYYAITSDFRVNLTGDLRELPKRFLELLADRFTDRLMHERNDLVVNTASMTAVDAPEAGLLKEHQDFVETDRVHHLVYFVQEAIDAPIRKWLGLPAARARVAGRAAAALSTAPRLTLREAGPAVTATRRPTRRGETPTLHFQVVWGNISLDEGDVYAVGHYLGVLPQRAELALDLAVSGIPAGTPRGEVHEADLVLTNLTRRRMLRGELGEIRFFPWGSPEHRGRLVAVCGMGHSGRFGEGELRQLHRNLSRNLVTLPEPSTLCTVLIGAGEGALPIRTAVEALVGGFTDTLRSEGDATKIVQVRIVEYDRPKADLILETLQDLERDAYLADQPALFLGVQPEVAEGGGGGTSLSYQWAVALGALARSAGKAGRGSDPSLDAVLAPARTAGLEIARLRRGLAALDARAGHDVGRLSRELRVRLGEAPSESEDASRVSFVREGNAYRASVLTNSTTIPERVIDVDRALVADLAERMTDPPPEQVEALSEFLFRLVVPRELRPFVPDSNPLVLELDRATAPVPWEMLATSPGDPQARPLALARQLARQLRTTYAPVPEPTDRVRGEPRALVIGDPGDPARGEDLPGARREAVEVARWLGSHFRVELLLGPPIHSREKKGLAVQEASRFEVLRRLVGGEYDLVHYCGHGDYDDTNPSRTGWIFHDGLLTAREIARMDTAPPLIVANACLSGRTSAAARGGADVSRPFGEAGLLPSLADEFFRRGVLNYVGSAWEVDDEGAVLFAKTLYGTLLVKRATLGRAMLEARRVLADDDRFGTLWAAYQHYGDPGWRPDHR